MDEGNRERHPMEQVLRDWQERMVEAVSHQRHDWMNDLQLILGYIQLQKYDKLKAYVETIKDKAAQESAIFKLGVPELSLELFALMSSGTLFELEVESAESFSLSEHPRKQAEFAANVRRLGEAFREAALPMEAEPNQLHISLSGDGQAAVCHCEYHGTCSESGLRESLDAQIRECESKGFRMESLLGEQWVTATFWMPLT